MLPELQRLYDFVNGTNSDAEQVDGELNNIINYVRNDIMTQPPWTAATLKNSWVNYDSSGAIYPTAKYRKDNFGMVHLEGAVKNGSSTILTLPVGFRPGRTTHRVVYTGELSQTLGSVQITATGDITPLAGVNTLLSLGGISFLAEG